MATERELAIVIRGKDELSAILDKVGKDLNALGKSASSSFAQATKAAQTLTPAVAAVGAGLTLALGSAVKVAADFEEVMSGVKAVMDPADVAQFGGSLEKLALQLGKDTAFSAKEAAAGIEELVKGGLSATDILDGAAKSTLALAAAGGVSLPDAATIAANALAQFSLKGEDMAHVADLIAGAANASAIDVGQFKLSLQAAGAVASTVGFSFDDLAQAIAVMGKAGIASSDAGTSLKTLMLNLIPTTKAQNAEMQRLGITMLQSDQAFKVLATGVENNAAALKAWERHMDAGTDTLDNLFTVAGNFGIVDKDIDFNKWALDAGFMGNQFFDASGKVKSMADVAEILQAAMADMTEQQRLASLEILFGSDAIRAGAILAKEGAEGFSDMANAMSKVTAEAVGAKRLDNLNGSLKQLQGSIETVTIMLGQKLIPLFRPLIDGATKAINVFMDLSEEWQTAIAIGAAVATGIVALTAAGLALLAVLPAITAGFAAVGTIAGVVAGVLSGPVVLAIGAVVAAGALLVTAWTQNWGDIQGKTAAVWAFLSEHVFEPLGETLGRFTSEVLPELQAAWESVSTKIQEAWATLDAFLRPAIAAFARFWEEHHETIERVVDTYWGLITAALGAWWELFSGILIAGLKILQGDWQGAWDTMRQSLADAWALIQTALADYLALLASALVAAWEGIKAVAASAWAAIGRAIVDSFDREMAKVQRVIDWAMGLIAPVLDKIQQITSFRPPDLSGALNAINQVRQGAAEAIQGVARISGDTAGLTPGSAEWWAEKNFQGRQWGGPVAAGMPYIVGEAGRELFVPNQSGTIIPNHALGGTTIILEMDRLQIARVLAPYITDEQSREVRVQLR